MILIVKISLYSNPVTKAKLIQVRESGSNKWGTSPSSGARGEQIEKLNVLWVTGAISEEALIASVLREYEEKTPSDEEPLEIFSVTHDKVQDKDFAEVSEYRAFFKSKQ